MYKRSFLRRNSTRKRKLVFFGLSFDLVSIACSALLPFANRSQTELQERNAKVEQGEEGGDAKRGEREGERVREGHDQ